MKFESFRAFSEFVWGTKGPSIRDRDDRADLAFLGVVSAFLGGFVGAGAALIVSAISKLTPEQAPTVFFFASVILYLVALFLWVTGDWD